MAPAARTPEAREEDKPQKQLCPTNRSGIKGGDIREEEDAAAIVRFPREEEEET